MPDAREALLEVERQRWQLADRMSVPLGYLALYGSGYAALTAGPILSSEYRLGLIGFGLMMLGALVLASPPVLLPKLRRVGMPDMKRTRFPSLRRNMPKFVLALFAPLAVSSALFLADRPTAALCGPVVGAALAPAALVRLHRGMAEDIRTGHAQPKKDRPQR